MKLVSTKVNTTLQKFDPRLSNESRSHFVSLITSLLNSGRPDSKEVSKEDGILVKYHEDVQLRVSETNQFIICYLILDMRSLISPFNPEVDCV